MPPEDIPEDAIRSFPCPMCGKGDVTLHDGTWMCINCAFEQEDVSPFEEGAVQMHEDESAGAIPLAAELHSDGTIHIYVDGDVSGLWVGMDGAGGLIVGVNEATRLAKRGD